MKAQKAPEPAGIPERAITMSENTIPFDAAAYLETPEDIGAFLDEALAMDDPAFFAHALGIARRATSMTEVAEIAGVKREAP